MSRGLGAMERAVAKAIAQCRKRDEGRDAILAAHGQPSAPRPVLVTPRNVCDAKPPSRAQLNSAARAMRSFVRKFPQYGLISGVGRGRLTLYERGDELSAMWAKLNSQRQNHEILTSAKAALEHLKARRNEPFVVHKKRQLDFVVTGAGRKETRRRKQVYRDISLPF